MSDLFSSLYTTGNQNAESGRNTSNQPQISIAMSSEDDISVVDSPEDVDVQLNELSDHDRQLASLATYLKSVPYECESVEEMHAKLEYIVGKIYISIESKNFLSHWDGMLQWYVVYALGPRPVQY
jgi:HEAT repeat protein